MKGKYKCLCATLAVLGYMSQSPVQAASIDIVGATSFQMGVDTQFDIDIYANDLLEGLNPAGDLNYYTQGGGLTIDYDPSVIQVNATSFDQFGTNQYGTIIWDFFKSATFNNTTGRIDLFVSRIGPTPMPASQLLSSIRFDIIGVGNTLLDISSADVSIGGFAYTADTVPSPAPGPLETISAFYCVGGVQTYDNAGMPTCGHGAPDGTPSIYLNDAMVSVSAVPIPPAVWLFGSGLIGLIGVARRAKV